MQLHAIDNSSCLPALGCIGLAVEGGKVLDDAFKLALFKVFGVAGAHPLAAVLNQLLELRVPAFASFNTEKGLMR